MTLDPFRVTLAGLTLGAATLVLIDAPAPLRIPVVSIFVLIAPGLAWARTLPIHDAGDLAGLAVALSMAMAAIIAGAAALLGWWSPFGMLVVLAIVTGVGLAVPAADEPATSRLH